MPTPAPAYTAEQQAALLMIDAYHATCRQRELDLRFAAEQGCQQSQRELPFIDRWSNDYWDDVSFTLQMRLGLDDDQLDALLSSV